LAKDNEVTGKAPEPIRAVFRLAQPANAPGEAAGEPAPAQHYEKGEKAVRGSLTG